jgi:metal-dependent amidase/aminoacylase/carboxypeptidase family protein
MRNTNPETGNVRFRSKETKDRYMEQMYKQHEWLVHKLETATTEEAKIKCRKKLSEWYSNHPKFYVAKLAVDAAAAVVKQLKEEGLK